MFNSNYDTLTVAIDYLIQRKNCFLLTHG